MKLDLIYSGHHFPRLAKLLQICNRPVGDSDCLHFAGFVDFFHLAPGLTLVPGVVDGARAVGVDWKKLA